jgi:hypothetical protein
MAKSEKYTFNGWNWKAFIEGRKKLLITLVGAIAGYVATTNPLLAVIAAASAELLVALIDYWQQD